MAVGFQQSSAPEAGRSEIAELRLEIERLRGFVEMRAQVQENMMRAMVVESAARAREALEERIQLAAREAIAFAHQGLEQHEAALRALGGRVAELSREPASEGEAAYSGAPERGRYAFGVAGDDGSDCRRIEVGDESDPAFLTALRHLPILPGGAEKLVAAHVVEFTPMAALTEKILPHWRSRLAPGGELVVVTLDGSAWAAELSRGDGGFEALRRTLGADGAGRPVRNLFDADGLAAVLSAAGFAPDSPETSGRRLKIVARLATT